jgi:hypothetical protein
VTKLHGEQSVSLTGTGGMLNPPPFDLRSDSIACSLVGLARPDA